VSEDTGTQLPHEEQFLLEQLAHPPAPRVVMALALGEPATMGPPVLKFPREMSLVVSLLPQAGQMMDSSPRTISSNSLPHLEQAYS
jgi:hypothetical protein